MKKMGKKFLIGTAMTVTAVSSAAVLSSCITAGVYGPPEYFGTTTLETASQSETGISESTPNGDTSGETTLETTIETDFTTESEINEDVYGPPEYFGISTSETAIETDFTSESEINEGVYGPPEDYTDVHIY